MFQLHMSRILSLIHIFTHVYVYDADGDFALEGTYVPLDQNTQNGYTGLLLRDGKWKYYQNGALEENYICLLYTSQNSKIGIADSKICLHITE